MRYFQLGSWSERDDFYNSKNLFKISIEPNIVCNGEGRKEESEAEALHTKPLTVPWIDCVGI